MINTREMRRGTGGDGGENTVTRRVYMKKLMFCLMVAGLLFSIPGVASAGIFGGGDEITNNYYDNDTYNVPIGLGVAYAKVYNKLVNRNTNQNWNQNLSWMHQGQTQEQVEWQLQGQTGIVNDGDQIVNIEKPNTAPPILDMEFVHVIQGDVIFSSNKYGMIISKGEKGYWMVRWWTKTTPVTGQIDIEKWVAWPLDRVENQDVIKWLSKNYAKFAEQYDGDVCVKVEVRDGAKGFGSTTSGGGSGNPATDIGLSVAGMFGRTIVENTEYPIITIHTTLPEDVEYER